MVHDHAEKKVRRLAVCEASGVRKQKIFTTTFVVVVVVVVGLR